VEDSTEATNQLFYEKGWTDGLPIVCPTEERVQAMLQCTDRATDEVLAEIPPLYGEATTEKVAINAIMAGCLPQYLPVIIAAVDAMTVKTFNLYGIQGTTNPVCPAAIINGPIAKELGINWGPNLIGQGNRANATIGRALRLIMLNLGGGTPGTVDKATHGQPGKYSLCFAENEVESPWEPLHVERGFAKEVSTVTVAGVTGTTNVLTMVEPEGPLAPEVAAERLLLCLADAIAAWGSNNWMSGIGEPMVIFAPESAQILDKGGFTKAKSKEYLYEKSSRPVSSYPSHMAGAMRFRRQAPETVDRFYTTESPDDIMIVVAGGLLSAHTVFAPTFGTTTAATKAIALKDGTPAKSVKDFRRR
ncbi:MAG: UGSC family (seleno)protein, partial [Chloroflexota bacterium]